MLWLIPAAVGIGTFAVLVGRVRAGGRGGSLDDGDDASRDRDPDAPTHATAGTMLERSKHVRVLAAMAGAPPAWQDMFALIARGESGGNPNRGLGIKTGAPPWAQMGKLKGEANAAAKVYKSGKKHVGDCVWGDAVYSFGSGGLFAMLPMSGLKAFWSDELLRCLHPWSVFDEKVTMVMAAHFAYRLTQRGGYQGTAASLRRGWGIPGKMSSIPADKLEKWRSHAQDVGLAPSFLDAKLPPWKPIPATDMFAAMGCDPLWLPKPALYTARMAA